MGFMNFVFVLVAYFLSLVNKVILVGRVGADPDVATLEGDRKVVNYTVATSETRNDKEGRDMEIVMCSDFILQSGSHGSDR